MFDGRLDKTKVCCENINLDDFQPKEIRSTEIKDIILLLKNLYQGMSII